MSWITVPATENDMNGPIDSLQSELTQGSLVNRVMAKAVSWDGEVLLFRVINHGAQTREQ